MDGILTAYMCMLAIGGALMVFALYMITCIVLGFAWMVVRSYCGR